MSFLTSFPEDVAYASGFLDACRADRANHTAVLGGVAFGCSYWQKVMKGAADVDGNSAHLAMEVCDAQAFTLAKVAFHRSAFGAFAQAVTGDVYSPTEEVEHAVVLRSGIHFSPPSCSV